MTNAQRYFENLVNVEHKVLGVKLKPFSILHYQWLQHIGSPLVNTSEQVTKADLELAVLICSSSSNEEILEKLQPKWYSFTWTERKVWRIENKLRDLKTHLLKFIAYQDDYCSLPEFVSSGDDKDEKLPWLLLYVASIVKHTGWDEEKVMTMPLGKVIWLNTAFSYLNSGETSVVSDRAQLAMKLLSESLTQAT